jgi:hypothetical protein
MIVNDHVVGRLGAALGAPVGAVALVDVPAELVALQPEMQHMLPGTCHGSLYLPHVSEREGLMHWDVPQNKRRFARLAVLYGWVVASDHQFVYENSPPNLVYSVDHGHFFPGGPNWTEAALVAAPAPDLDLTLTCSCNLAASEIAAAKAALLGIDDAVIADAVAGPPDAWGMTEDERVVLAQYLSIRREQLSAKLRN